MDLTYFLVANFHILFYSNPDVLNDSIVKLNVQTLSPWEIEELNDYLNKNLLTFGSQMVWRKVDLKKKKNNNSYTHSSNTN